MAHRGRLNALVHTVGRSYQSILREFEGERSIDALVVDPEGGTGDVKYHLPASGTRVTASGEIDVTIVPNPSHLEAADPVVEGRARAEQTDRSSGAGIHDPSVALPVLIHGDAAFPGQGVVAETLNLQSLEGYATGGTLHLITNNQVGYTTDPAESRSTRYSSDLAKGFDVPIVHVNADDPEAALSADPARARLPHRVRPRLRDRPRRLPALRPQRAGRRVVHAAADGRADPRAADRARPSTRRGSSTRARSRRSEAEALVGEGHGHAACGARAAPDGDRDDAVRSAGRARRDRSGGDDGRRGRHGGRRRPSARAQRTAARRARRASPINAKLAKQLERRRETIVEGGIDWGQAEALAYATLLEDGIPIRLSGQDAERGTFAHRHLVFHDPYTGETYAPIQHLPGGQRVVRGLQLAALGVRGARVRVRLLRRGAGRARPLGGPVRRLRQRRPDRDRPVPRRRPLEVGPDVAADAAAPARLRGQRPRALERAARAVPPAGSAGQHPDRELHDGGPVLPPPPSAGARRHRAAARRDDAEGPAPAQAGRLDARGSLDGLLPRRHSRSRARERTSAGSCSAAARSTTTSSVTARGRARPTSRSRGSSSCTRSRSRRVAEVIAGLPHLEEIVWAQEEPQNMGAWRSIRHRLDDAARSSSTRRRRHLRRALVARVAERGVPDRAPARAGPHRARRPRRHRRLIRRGGALRASGVPAWQRRPPPRPSGRAAGGLEQQRASAPGVSRCQRP